MKTSAEKKLAEDARLSRAWRNWHRDQLEEVLAGPYREVATQLVVILRELSLRSAPVLLEFIRSQNWKALDYNTRLVLLHEVNTAIIKLREHNDMSPFDDGMPDGRLNVFQTIRAIVVNENDSLSHATSVAPPGAQPGSINKTPNQDVRTCRKI
jgi:hypothetical protein